MREWAGEDGEAVTQVRHEDGRLDHQISYEDGTEVVERWAADGGMEIDTTSPEGDTRTETVRYYKTPEGT